MVVTSRPVSVHYDSYVHYIIISVACIRTYILKMFLDNVDDRTMDEVLLKYDTDRNYSGASWLY